MCKKLPTKNDRRIHQLLNHLKIMVNCYDAGQPKRHLLTTGWSSFVGAKRLKAGDMVIFIR